MTAAELEADNRQLRDMAIRLTEELLALLRKRRKYQSIRPPNETGHSN